MNCKALHNDIKRATQLAYQEHDRTNSKGPGGYHS